MANVLRYNMRYAPKGDREKFQLSRLRSVEEFLAQASGLMLVQPREHRMPAKWLSVKRPSREERKERRRLLIEKMEDPNKRTRKSGRSNWSTTTKGATNPSKEQILRVPRPPIYPWKKLAWARQGRRVRSLRSRLLWTGKLSRSAGRDRYKLHNYRLTVTQYSWFLWLMGI